MLKGGGIINLLIAAGHLVCLFWLDATLRFCNVDGYMAKWAAGPG